jgi:hypothetical protein
MSPGVFRRAMLFGFFRNNAQCVIPGLIRNPAPPSAVAGLNENKTAFPV